MPRLRIGDIARQALVAAEQLVARWLPAGRRVGHEWICGDLTGGAGDSCSINLTTGQWADFAGDDRGGDLVSLYAAIHGVKQGEAARAVAAELGIATETPAAGASRASTSPRRRYTGTGGEPGAPMAHGAAKPPAGSAGEPPAAAAAQSDAQSDAQPDADRWHDAGPWPADGPPAPVAHSVRGRPQARWAYHDAQGRLLGYVCRFATSTGGKEIIPLTWSRHATKGLAWRWRQFDDPRPLYGQQLLEQRPGAPVLVVEGEKCVDAAQMALGTNVVVVTWPGGCKAVDKADWALLAGRRVVCWPDADAKADKAGALLPPARQPGQRAMLAAAQRLQERCEVRLVALPAPGALADGYDVADVIDAARSRMEDAATAVRAWLQPDKLVPIGELQTPTLPAGAAGTDVADRAPVDVSAVRWRDELLWDRGKLLRHAANVSKILQHDDRWAGVVAYDEFAQTTVKLKPPPYAYGRTGEWTDDDDTRTTVWLAQHYLLAVTSVQVSEAITMVAREAAFHPVVQHLRALPRPAPDAERELPHWITRYLGVEDSPFVQCVAQFFMRGMVKRVLEPGCKFDYCLVVEGAEGLRKSTLAAVLGSRWGSDVPIDLSNNREASNALHGVWVVEFAEMDSVSRAEAPLQKSFLSRQVDQYRPVWGRRNIKVPRQCVFVGTINPPPDGYIKEGQGARRFWPVLVTRPIDIDGLRAALPRLLAEALADVDAGERCYPTYEEQQEIFAPEQQQRVIQEGLIDALHDWVLHPTFEETAKRSANDGAFSIADAAARALHISYAQLTRDLQTRIGSALHKLGCTRIEKRNGMTRYWYKPPTKKAATFIASQPAQPPGEADAPIPF